MKHHRIRLVLALGVLLALLLTAGCTKGCQQRVSHLKSNLVGLDRTITLYAHDGSVIRAWDGRFQVEATGGSARFIDQGKAVYISGTFVIEEK